jgi:hypothetical protein
MRFHVLSRILRTAAILGYSSIALTISAGCARAANLVVNANFQFYTGGFNGNPSQLGDSGTGGYTALTGWTVGPGSSGLLGFLFASGTADTTGSHDVRFNDTFLLWGPGSGGGGVNNGLPASSPDGGNYLALDAAPTYQGSISQTVTGLTKGKQYVVSFYWAAAQQHGFDGATTESLKISFGNSSQTTSTINLNSHAFSGWRSASFIFTADAASDVLSFLTQGGPDGLPPFILLDGVAVNPTPEPGSLAMMLGGVIGGVGLIK